MGEWFGDAATSGSLLLAVPVAVLAGLVSFFSPCVLPLLPGYVSYVTGLSAADLADTSPRPRGRVLLGTGLFVLGFSAVFVSYGTLFGAAGFWLREQQRTVDVVMGVVIVVLGFAFMGFVPFLQRDVRIHRIPAVGIVPAPLIGALFGLGWVPCIGPTLGAVLGLALGGADPARGALLAFVYCLGLGVPFVLAGLGLRRFMGAVGWVRRHQRGVAVAGGGMLVVVGVLLVTGLWSALLDDLLVWVSGYGTVI